MGSESSCEVSDDILDSMKGKYVQYIYIPQTTNIYISDDNNNLEYSSLTSTISINESFLHKIVYDDSDRQFCMFVPHTLNKIVFKKNDKEHGKISIGGIVQSASLTNDGTGTSFAKTWTLEIKINGDIYSFTSPTRPYYKSGDYNERSYTIMHH